MADIELGKEVEQALIAKLQQYLADELQVELGNFETQFLLDFFADHAGCFFYNQGLADALKAFEDKIDELNDIVYQLEQTPPDD